MTTPLGTKMFADQHNGVTYIRDNINKKSTTVSMDMTGRGDMNWLDVKDAEDEKDIVAELVKRAYARGVEAGREQMRVEVENGMKAFLGIFVSSSD
jgi:hypothetical protein